MDIYTVCSLFYSSQRLTLQQLKDTMVLVLNLQVKVGAVAQHDSLLHGHLAALAQQAEDAEGQLQHIAHPGLHGTRGEVHGHGLHHIHLEMEEEEGQCRVEGSQDVDGTSESAINRAVKKC